MPALAPRVRFQQQLRATTAAPTTTTVHCCGCCCCCCCKLLLLLLLQLLLLLLPGLVILYVERFNTLRCSRNVFSLTNSLSDGGCESGRSSYPAACDSVKTLRHILIRRDHCDLPCTHRCRGRVMDKLFAWQYRLASPPPTV
jgi:hypothetical protein